MTSHKTIPLLMTGANGLIGSVFARDYAEKYAITNLDISGSPNVDITNELQIDEIFAAHPADLVIHFAAFTDVTAAWQQTGDKSGIAYRVNVLGTANIVKACEKYHKKLLHLSTAYVFSGTKTEPYVESDEIGPLDWYGQTKAWAEDVVLQSTADWVILRIDNPFRQDTCTKPDVVRRILAKLYAGNLPPQFADSYFGPTSIEDLAKVIDWTIRTNQRGIFHATANESWTQLAFAQAVAKKAGFDPTVVKVGSLTEYLNTISRPYPRNTALDCTKLFNQIDFLPRTIKQAIHTISLS